MGAAALSIVGGTNRFITTYNMDVIAEEPMERPNLAPELFTRNKDAQPLLRITEMLGLETGWDEVHKWKEAEVLDEEDELSTSAPLAGIAAGQLTVSDGNRFTERDVLFVNDLWHLWLTANPIGNVVTGVWLDGPPPAALAAGTPVILIGNSYYQRDTPNVSPWMTTVEYYNAYQTLLTEVEHTTKADVGNYYYQNEPQRLIDANFEFHRTLVEKTTIFGQRYHNVAGASPVGMLRGLWFWSTVVTDVGGVALTEDTLCDWVVDFFQGNRMNVKAVCFASMQGIRQVSDALVAGTHIQVNITPDTKVFGVTATTLRVAGKEVNFIHHPLFDLHGWNDKMLLINATPEVLKRINHRDDGGTRWHPHTLPYGEDQFFKQGSYKTDWTIRPYWAAQNIRAIDGLATT